MKHSLVAEIRKRTERNKITTNHVVSSYNNDSFHVPKIQFQ